MVDPVFPRPSPVQVGYVGTFFTENDGGVADLGYCVVFGGSEGVGEG